MLKPVSDDFFLQPTLLLTQSLLGSFLIHETPDGITSGMIVEAEAYIGPDDKAAHSYGGRPTERTRVMYGPPGYSYVYQIYGLHYCFNVVSGSENAPEAILIRALEPIDGIPIMIQRRKMEIAQEAGGTWPHKKIRLLTNGPGKLAQAMGITKEQNGWNLRNSPLRIATGQSPVESDRIATGPRIGIDYAEEARGFPWRFWLKGNPFVSKS